MVTATLYCDVCGSVNRSQAQFCFSCGESLQEVARLRQHAGNTLPTPPTPAEPGTLTGHLLPGHLLKQRYRILAQVGQGGMGAVYKAEDTQFGDRLVAVKEMHQNGLRSDEIVAATESFKREAMLLAGLLHPNLPRTYDHFFDGGRWYLVMDFIEGQTLEEYLNKIPATGASRRYSPQGNTRMLTVDEVLDIGVQLCTILHYLHTGSPPIIFRDLKPGNIMLTPAGHLYLFDFGIARHFKPGQARDTANLGSVGYAAPEQYGKAKTTPRSDIYSLGVTLHQLLSGNDPSRSPFRFSLLRLQNPPPPLAFEDLIIRMVDLDEARRPDSALTVKEELQRLAMQRATAKSKGQPVLPAGRANTQPLPPANASLTLGITLGIYRGHRGRVLASAWSPDSACLASGGSDYTVQVWRAMPGDTLLTYRGHNEWVKSLAWSPDGTRIASAGADTTVQIWDAQTGSPFLTYYNHTNIISAVAWSPDGKLIASGGYDKVVHVWDAATGDRLYTHYGHEGLVNDVAWSPDGTHIVSASDDGTVQVWLATPPRGKESKSGSLVFTYRGHADKVSAAAWSPNGKRIASGSWDNTVHVWDATTGGFVFKHKDHSSWINAVVWSPNGTRIASASNDQTVQVWEASSGREFFTRRTFFTYDGHTEWVRDVSWSSDGRYISSAGHDQTVRVWQAV
jgi:eukaryotic-like serine/threonine-protein kinase